MAINGLHPFEYFYFRQFSCILCFVCQRQSVNMENVNKSRMSKTTRPQYECLLGFLQNNKILLSGKTAPSEQKKISTLWHEFAVDVNSKCIGASKTAEQWKKVCLFILSI